MLLCACAHGMKSEILLDTGSKIQSTLTSGKLFVFEDWLRLKIHLLLQVFVDHFAIRTGLRQQRIHTLIGYIKNVQKRKYQTHIPMYSSICSTRIDKSITQHKLGKQIPTFEMRFSSW